MKNIKRRHKSLKKKIFLNNCLSLLIIIIYDILAPWITNIITTNQIGPSWRSGVERTNSKHYELRLGSIPTW